MDEVLTACSHGSLLDKGMCLLSLMEKDYVVKSTD